MSPTTPPAPAQNSEICDLPARRLAALIKTGQLSSREVMTAFLKQIDDLNPRFNAIISRVPHAALLAQADAADQAIARKETVGALHGLPMAVKDTTDTAGIVTTYGSPIYRNHVPAADGLMVSRLRKAGAIFIGKTNVPEFGLGSHTFNPIFGATGNAWDPRYNAGGSSGGAAVATALRMLPFADGSDLGGSLRNPAAFNNILGFRPSHGRVPHWPRQETFMDQLMTEGPLARSADDLALLLSVQAGYDPRVPLALDAATPDWHDQLGADLRGKRIGWLGDLSGYLAFEPGILEMCKTALDRFNEAGILVESIQPDFDWKCIWRAFVVLRQFDMGAKFAAAYDDAKTRDLMKPELQWEIENSRALRVHDVQQAMIDRTAWYDMALSLFERFDYLAVPSAQVFPFAIEKRWPEQIADRKMDSYHRWIEVMVPGTLTGCPIMSLPVGFNAAGLPMGVQIIGRPRNDLSVLQLTHLFEALTPSMKAAPPAAQLRG
jgi:amidase